jgi:hypothetical protein
MMVRRERYRALYEDPNGPIRHGVLPYEDLFVEPFYQLFRLTLLADQMERSHEEAAERVRLLYVAPARNADLWTSLNRASHRALADQLVDDDNPRAVEAVWSSMCRRPDRFVYMDSARFVEMGSPASDEFRSRYGHLGGDEPAPRTRNAVVAPLIGYWEEDWSELSWDGPWAELLPLAWWSVTAGSGAYPVPEPPETRASFDSIVGPLAWWTPLPHLLAYSLGWSDLARGLHAWHELGRPVDDARFEVIETWWGSAAIALAYWLDLRSGDGRAGSALDRLVASARDSGDVQLERMLRALVEGGTDPLHLSGHAPIEPNSTPDAPEPVLFADDARTSRVALFERYNGWYESLMKVASDAGVRWVSDATHINVVCREVGWLGRYRRSPVTGRWFAGSHRLHLFGQP